MRWSKQNLDIQPLSALSSIIITIIIIIIIIVVIKAIKVRSPVSVTKDKQISGGEDAVLVGSHLYKHRVYFFAQKEGFGFEFEIIYTF